MNYKEVSMFLSYERFQVYIEMILNQIRVRNKVSFVFCISEIG